MAERKKACIVHIAGDQVDITVIRERLGEQGYEVHDIAVSAEDAEAVELSGRDTTDVPDEVRECVDSADLIVLLISDSTAHSCVGGAALNAAQSSGARIVGVWANGGAATGAPQVMRDYADALVHPQSEKFPAAVCGEGEVWEGPTGMEEVPPKKKHQKCQ